MDFRKKIIVTSSLTLAVCLVVNLCVKHGVLSGFVGRVLVVGCFPGILVGRNATVFRLDCTT